MFSIKPMDSYDDGRRSPAGALLLNIARCYSSPRPGRRRRACFLALSLLLCAPMWAQLASPSPSPPTVPPGAPSDALGRTTPQSTVLNFLAAGTKGANEVAADLCGVVRLKASVGAPGATVGGEGDGRASCAHIGAHSSKMRARKHPLRRRPGLGGE
jgi:hypothetical protein